MVQQQVLAWLVLTALIAGCAPGPASPTAQPEPGRVVVAAPKRVVVGIRSEPKLFSAELTQGEHGTVAVMELLGAGLVMFDGDDQAAAQLAVAAPSAENGLWRVFPDGRMETTWRIREGAEWHDRTPFTSADVAFTIRLAGVIGGFDHPALRFLDRLETPDDRTVVAHWKRPFIDADQLFTRETLLPLPRHVLERSFDDDPTSLIEHPYWNEEFVGTGPYRLRELARGSHLVLEANDRYVLGRPKIDVIEVRFVLSTDVLVTQLLAGQVEMTLGSTLSLEQALEVRDRSHDFTMSVGPRALQRALPQLTDPDPPIIGQVEFRRALLHAIDRQEMIDTLESGMTAVPVSFLPPNQQQYQPIEAPLPRYEFDPRRAAGMIAALGYTPGPDGVFVGLGGQRLVIELRNHAGDDSGNKMALAIAGYWQRAGVGVDMNFVPRQRQPDIEYRALRPAFHFAGGNSDFEGLKTMHSAEIPRPQTGWRGTNHSRYVSPAYDALYDQFVSTIPKTERMEALGQVLLHIAVELPVLPVYYRVDPTIAHSRLMNVGPRKRLSTQAWNSHEWDVR